jgi:coatomer subunit beta
MLEGSAPFLCPPKDGQSPKWDELEEDLRAMNNQKRQMAALSALIQFQASGEIPPDSVLMTTIQYVATSQNHQIKKLLFLYYEIVETRDRKGNLKQEFLLICDALRNDLIHPNEYLRAAALRLVSRFQEVELISPLVHAIRQSLTHASAYVRRHAIVALGRIYQKWPHLARDAPAESAELLRVEGDAACKRVAFLVLCDISRDLAAEFLDDLIDHSLLSLSQPMQLTATALIKRMCCDKRKASYLSALAELISSPYPGVQLESALALLELSSTPTASRAGLTALTHIMLNIPNVSLQLSIADQIERLIPSHTSVCQSLAVEFLAALKAKPVRAKILKIVELLVTAENASDVSTSLIRHLQAAGLLRQKENEKEEAEKFMRLILGHLRVIATTHPSALRTVYEGASPLIADTEPLIATDAMLIVRDTVALSVGTDLRNIAILHLENLISCIHVVKVFRMGLYLLSIYSDNNDIIGIICDALTHEADAGTGISTTTVVLTDGTYVQRTSGSAAPINAALAISERLPKDPFLISNVAMCLARLVCRLPECDRNRAIAFTKHLLVAEGIDREIQRIGLALVAMENPDRPNVREVIIRASEESFERCVQEEHREIAVKPVVVRKVSAQNVGGRLHFGSLLGRRFDAPVRVVQPFEKRKGELAQMTGTSDPIFSECRMIANTFDISLDFRLLNQTNIELKNVRVELNCVGKLELIDRPAGLNLPAGAAENVKFSVKVTSAEAGRVFGTITYEVNGLTSSDQRILPLAVITVSSADYMQPEGIEPALFRKKWDDFEWEKKLSVSQAAESLEKYVNRICEGSKLKMTMAADMSLGFVTCNLYSRSYFGEEVLANLNVEWKDGMVSGFLRLRTASQMMALAFSRLIQSLE